MRSSRSSWSRRDKIALASLIVALMGVVVPLLAARVPIPHVQLSPTPTAVPTQTSAIVSTPTPMPATPATNCGDTTNDEFADSLQPAWIWTDPGKNATKSVSQGFLNITVPDGNDLYPSTNYNAPRLLQQIGSTGFSSETFVKILSGFTQSYQGAGLLFWQDPQNFVRLERGTGGIVFDQNQDGKYTHLVTDPTTALQVELLLQRNGNTLTAFWREPDQTWQQLGSTTAAFSTLFIGLTAIAQYGVPPVSAQYGYFRLTCK